VTVTAAVELASVDPLPVVSAAPVESLVAAVVDVVGAPVVAVSSPVPDDDSVVAPVPESPHATISTDATSPPVHLLPFIDRPPSSVRTPRG
jgi:hypothetical protein